MSDYVPDDEEHKAAHEAYLKEEAAKALRAEVEKKIAELKNPEATSVLEMFRAGDPAKGEKARHYHKWMLCAEDREKLTFVCVRPNCGDVQTIPRFLSSTVPIPHMTQPAISKDETKDDRPTILCSVCGKEYRYTDPGEAEKHVHADLMVRHNAEIRKEESE